MREIEATYLTHMDEEGYPPTIVRFAPGEDPQRVVFSQNRYGIFDELEDATLEESNDEEALYELLESVRTEHDDEAGDRFWIYDAHDDPYGVEWFVEYGFGARWHSSNAWRGYTVPVFDEDKLETFATGWVTGFPDETVSHKRVAEYLFEALINGDLEPPFEVFWFMAVTSNVFSQSADILIPAGKDQEFEAWIDASSFDYTAEEVTRAFS